ncbi:MAG TPA: hypothetical protein VK633_03895 [Verrucomicrobiae bacterium]|nr:hypothetical protein [Verrucomicrobiae bacterium]
MKTPQFENFIQAARAVPANESVPYLFEKRVMARLGSAEPHDLWSVVVATMWRAAFGCLALTVVVTAFVELRELNGTDLLATDLERTVLASVEVEDTW